MLLKDAMGRAAACCTAWAWPAMIAHCPRCWSAWAGAFSGSFLFQYCPSYRFSQGNAGPARYRFPAMAPGSACLHGCGMGRYKGGRRPAKIAYTKTAAIHCRTSRGLFGMGRSLVAASKESLRDDSGARLSDLAHTLSASDAHFTRLRVHRSGHDIGWAVVGERRKDGKYGAMRVGSIVDCWALPEDALPVVQAASAALIENGVRSNHFQPESSSLGSRSESGRFLDFAVKLYFCRRQEP